MNIRKIMIHALAVFGAISAVKAQEPAKDMAAPSSPSGRVQVSAKVVIFDEAMVGKLGLDDLTALGKVTPAQFKAMQEQWATRGKDFQEIQPDKDSGTALDHARERAASVKAVLELPPIVADSGQRARLAMLREITQPSAWEPVGKGPKQTWKATEWEKEDVGLVIDAGLAIIPLPRNINLHLKLNLRASYLDHTLYQGPGKGPLGEGITAPVDNLFLADGHTLVLGGDCPVPDFMASPDAGPKAELTGRRRPLLICLTAQILGAPAAQAAPVETAALETRRFTAPSGTFHIAKLPQGEPSIITAILKENGFTFPPGTSAESLPAKEESRIQVRHTAATLNALADLVRVRQKAEEQPRSIQLTVTLFESQGSNKDAVDEPMHKVASLAFNHSHKAIHQMRGRNCELACRMGTLTDAEADDVCDRLQRLPGVRMHPSQTFVIGDDVTSRDCPLIPDLALNDPRYPDRLAEWKLDAREYSLKKPVFKAGAKVASDGHAIDLSLEGPQWCNGLNMKFEEQLKDGESILIGGYEASDQPHHCLILVKAGYLKEP